MAVLLICVDTSIAGNHEVFEDTERELQDLVRLEEQWASSFGSAQFSCIQSLSRVRLFVTP